MTQTNQVDSTTSEKTGCCSACGDFKDMQKMMEQDTDCSAMMQKMCGNSSTKATKTE